jgi:endo-1,4-beta-xylanase
MGPFNRRKFFQNAAIGVAGVIASPLIKNYENIFAKTVNDVSVFKPFPHPWMPKMDFVYLTDEHEEPFKSSVQINQSGIVLPEDLRTKKFNVNTRWFVEDFGFIYLSADNGGQSYSVNDLSKGNLNLNYEFAKSRLERNRKIKKQYINQGAKFSNELNHLFSLSEELFEDATRRINDNEKCAGYSDKSLKYSLFSGEKIEIEYAQYEINRQKRKDSVRFGCESRQLVWAKSEEFVTRFPELFNYATITHYVWDSWYELFEPREGQYNWGVKDDILNFLTNNGITVEGRPLFWFHPTVTPDWLKQKNFSELKTYVEKHTKDLISHYGDKVLEWEVINEYHDWANIFNHTPEQITEIVKLACNKTKETNPKVKRLLNNCAPWGEYVAKGRMARMDATRPLRSVNKYIEDLITAEVDFDVLGIQVYYPARDLSDIVRMLERFEKFNKPMSITEIGASSGPSNETVFNGQLKLPSAPYEWRRPWDEDLQADWLEAVYTIYYSRPLIKTINWYDFSDFRPFIVNGGIVREDCSTKMSFNRLKNLLGSWNRLPSLTKS